MDNATAKTKAVKSALENAKKPALPPVIQAALDRLPEDAGAVFERDVIEAIKALRSTSMADFTRVRATIKKAGNVKMADFDQATAVKGADKGDDHLDLPEPDLWPEPVDGAKLLHAVEQQLAGVVVADPHTLRAATLWSAFTWFHGSVSVSPLAHITAPEKRCGKSVLLGCIAKVAHRPLPVSSISGAALFRAVEAWQPTLLIDEADSFLRDNEDLRGVLNSGFDRGQAFVARCDGDANEVKRFSTWAPKVLCGIGHLPATLEDRAIPLRLKRKLTSDKVQRLRRTDPRAWEVLAEKLARWSDDHQGDFAKVTPADIPGLNDRAQDAWEPLQEVAALAGGDWPELARQAATFLHGAEGDSPSFNEELLADIREVFDSYADDNIFTSELLEKLTADEEAPWATYNRGRPMSPRQLAKRLADFGIKSQSVRVGYDHRKGYKKAQFADVFRRHLPAGGISSGTTGQPSDTNGFSGFGSGTTTLDVPDEKALKARHTNDCPVVPDKNPPPGASGGSEDDFEEFEF